MIEQIYSSFLNSDLLISLKEAKSPISKIYKYFGCIKKKPGYRKLERSGIPERRTMRLKHRVLTNFLTHRPSRLYAPLARTSFFLSKQNIHFSNFNNIYI